MGGDFFLNSLCQSSKPLPDTRSSDFYCWTVCQSSFCHEFMLRRVGSYNLSLRSTTRLTGIRSLINKSLGFLRIHLFQGSMIFLFWAYVLSFILRLLRAAHRRVGILPYVFSYRSWQLSLWISVMYDIRMSQNARSLWASSNTGIPCLFSLWSAFLWLFPGVSFLCLRVAHECIQNWY